MVQPSVIWALSLTLLVSPGALRTGRATTGAATAVPADGGWPRAYITGFGARLVLYEPQVASWADQKRMVMYAAVSYTARDQQTPALGTIRIEADTKVSVEERLVNFSDLTITASNFPTLSGEQLTAVVGDIMSSVPREERVIGLDRVLAAVDTSQVKPRNVDDVKADPPRVFYSTTPAVLVNLDGDPIWSSIPDNDLRFAVNTNWDLFEHMASRSYFLRVDAAWLRASSIDGPWMPAGRLPDGFSRLPNDDNWKDARAALVAHSTGPAPTVFVSTKPAEMILLRGAPAYAAVAGTGLLWVSNTESDVFRAGRTGPVYYLVSGRWFSAPDFTGPWTFATLSLADDFKRIPLEHPRSRVLASVPGTTQALEAVLLAQVPQTARVSRTQVNAPDVVYQGEPQFQPIEKTTVARAVNTDKDVLKVGSTGSGQVRYYMCVDGVWFVSPGASGPWTLADSIPKEIYDIPISSPAYHATNVTVQSADDEAVVYATDAAYAGMMVAWGCAVWGTGWYYAPYVGWGGHYPVYYPRYPSYGYGAWYNPWIGSYTRAGVAYGPYGGAGYAARYNPTTGTYSRGAAAWGPGGARGAAQAWNPRAGMAAQTRRGANIYGRWGSAAVQRGDQWAKTSRFTNRAAGRTRAGNVFAGHDGNVYRNQGGTWQKYGSGGWDNVERPTGTSGELDQLNHDFSARRDGAQRTSDLGSIMNQSGSAYRGGAGMGSYRPSGGAFRGGGGFGGGGFRAAAGGEAQPGVLNPLNLPFCYCPPAHWIAAQSSRKQA
jgi:hypothetical protein